MANLLFCSLAAYPLARMNFRGRGLVLALVVATILIPFQVVMIPLYILAVNLGLRNTYLALNICWLLLMRAAFTNRFAYLSWSLQPWLIVYPFLGGRLVPTSLAGRRLDAHRRTVLAGVLLANVGFTYLMMMYVYPSRAE